MTRPAPAFVPRLLPAPAAAHYLGVSVSTLRGLPIPRKVLGGKRLYDERDLSAFVDGLPVEGEGANSCDEAFGV
jgi:hypothetical protein